jgi:DNA-binding MarR family transcriptional regulator
MSSGRGRRQQIIADLVGAIREVSGQGVLFSAIVAGKIGVNSTDLECLDIVMMRGPVTPSALAAGTGLTSGAITAVIDRLERAGFVRRERDADDRRQVLVTATPAVAKVVAPYGEPMQREVMAVLGRYRDGELQVLREILAECSKAAATAIAEVTKMPARKNARS